jgi:hypothetical protein
VVISVTPQRGEKTQWVAGQALKKFPDGKRMAIGLLLEMERKNAPPPFDRLRANGSSTEIVKDFPFVLSLSKHERRSPATSHLGKL